MKKILAFGLFCSLLFTFPFAGANTIRKVRYYESPLEGRYDLILYNSGKSYPAWLEVHHSGTRTLVGQYVGQGGSARPISVIHFADNKLSFSIPPQWDTAKDDLEFEALFQGDSLTG